MTEKTEELESELEKISCMWYPIIFKDQTETLLDSKNKLNAISHVFTSQLGLKIRQTNVGVNKIDSTTLQIYGMVVSIFLYQINIVGIGFLITAFFWLV